MRLRRPTLFPLPDFPSCQHGVTPQGTLAASSRFRDSTNLLVFEKNTVLRKLKRVQHTMEGFRD